MKYYIIVGLLFFLNALELGLILVAGNKENVQAILTFGLMTSLLITGLCMFALYILLTDRTKRLKRRIVKRQYKVRSVN